MRIFALIAALAAGTAFADRVTTGELNDLPGTAQVVTNVDLSGFVTDVGGKLDKSEIAWPDGSTVTGAQYAAEARVSKATAYATRAGSADTVSLTNATEKAEFFAGVTNGTVAVREAFSNAVESTGAVIGKVDVVAEAMAVSTNYFEQMTQAQKTELLRRLVEYVRKKEAISAR